MTLPDYEQWTLLMYVVIMGLSVFWAYPIMLWLYEFRVLSWDISTWWFVPLLLVGFAAVGHGPIGAHFRAHGQPALPVLDTHRNIRGAWLV